MLLTGGLAALSSVLTRAILSANPAESVEWRRVSTPATAARGAWKHGVSRSEEGRLRDWRKLQSVGESILGSSLSVCGVMTPAGTCSGCMDTYERGKLNH